MVPRLLVWEAGLASSRNGMAEGLRVLCSCYPVQGIKRRPEDFSGGCMIMEALRPLSVFCTLATHY